MRQRMLFAAIALGGLALAALDGSAIAAGKGASSAAKAASLSDSDDSGAASVSMRRETVSQDSGGRLVNSVLHGPSGNIISPPPFPSQGERRQPMRQDTLAPQGTPQAAPPAWAQGPFRPGGLQSLAPYGESLFHGTFANTYQDGLNSDYVIMPGDRVVVRIWGAKNYEDILIVDQKGNVFLPEVGLIALGGVKYGQLQSVVKGRLGSVYTSKVDAYAYLLNSQPVAVYLTGAVVQPGRYAGGPSDSVLYYLDRAQGIDPYRGSYRSISVVRGAAPVARIDLYDFLRNGVMPKVELKDGDVILAEPKGPSVAVMGLLRTPALYEFKSGDLDGGHLLEVAPPLNNVSHVSVTGVRNEMPYNIYLPLEKFRTFRLSDNDAVEYHADKPGNSIMVTATGAIEGDSRYPVRKDVTLTALLRHVAVDPKLADLDAIYVRRRSVAEQQKRTIADSLRRLEQSVLTAASASVDEANIRVREAELIQHFIKRVQDIEPDGVVVVSRKGQRADILLEDGDVIVIPQRSNIVQVSGEVMMPKAVVYEKGLNIASYIASAGGFSERANSSNILVVKPNGEITGSTDIGPGDQLLVMPKYDTKYLQAAKDLMQIIYQIAVATKIAVGL